MLNDNYQNYNDVKELIKLGDISGLREKVNSDNKEEETVAYHRNLGEDFKKNKPMITKSFDEFQEILFDSWIGYIYLYDEKNNKWLWDNYTADVSDLELKPLADCFKIEVKDLTCSEIKDLRNRNYEFLILQGCGGDLSEWVDGITNLFKENGIIPSSFSFDEIYSFENNDLTNMAFALNSKDIDMGKLALFRLKIRDQFGAMWLSDYIDNGYIKDINI